MPLDLFQNRASRPIKRPRNRPDAPAIKQSQLNGRAINNRQPASRNCHPTTLNYPATRGVFALKLESVVFMIYDFRDLAALDERNYMCMWNTGSQKMIVNDTCFDASCIY